MTANTSPTAIDALAAALSPAWRAKAACRGSAPADGTVQEHPWFEKRGQGRSNHGGVGKAACSSCEVRELCLLWAVATNESHGIHGGCGESDRRPLRRAFVGDGNTAGPQYRMAAARVELRLRGADSGPAPDRNGHGATCGNAATYARGHRCSACALAASFRGTMAKIDARRAA